MLSRYQSKYSYLLLNSHQKRQINTFCSQGYVFVYANGCGLNIYA